MVLQQVSELFLQFLLGCGFVLSANVLLRHSDLFLQDFLSLDDGVDVVAELNGAWRVFGGVFPELLGDIAIKLGEAGVFGADGVHGPVDIELLEGAVFVEVEFAELGEDFLVCRHYPQ